MTVLRFGLFLVVLSRCAVLCSALIFPWDNVAGLILKLGKPILGLPPSDLEPIAYMHISLNTDGCQIIRDRTVNLMELVPSAGYPIESYDVLTDDDYILTLVRIPHGRNGNHESSIASLLIHTGILTDASSFLMNTPENNAPYLLADAGFDVWILNIRGTYYSQKHRYLRADKDREYWNFSFHEAGKYDMPACVDFVINKTGRKQIYTLGYSMGAASTCIMLSERPEYQNKVRASFLVAPAVNFRDSKFRSFRVIATPILDIIGIILNESDVLGKSPNMVALYQTFCGGIGRLICLEFIDVVFGRDPFQFNRTRIEVYMSHILSGTSVKVIKHYLQMYSGHFRQFDYGTRENRKIYGRRAPPDYNLDVIQTPIVVMYGPGDDFVVSQDVIALSHRFKNLVSLIGVPNRKFNHLDYMCAKDTGTLFSQLVVNMLMKLEDDAFLYHKL